MLRRRLEQKRISKFEKKTDIGILLDYNEVGYGVLVNNKIIVARHVDIVDKDVKCVGLDESDEENNDCVNDESSYDGFDSADEIEQKKIKVK